MSLLLPLFYLWHKEGVLKLIKAKTKKEIYFSVNWEVFLGVAFKNFKQIRHQCDFTVFGSSADTFSHTVTLQCKEMNKRPDVLMLIQSLVES